jgi:hypothetical protein
MATKDCLVSPRRTMVADSGGGRGGNEFKGKCNATTVECLDIYITKDFFEDEKNASKCPNGCKAKK